MYNAFSNQNLRNRENLKKVNLRFVESDKHLSLYCRVSKSVKQGIAESFLDRNVSMQGQAIFNEPVKFKLKFEFFKEIFIVKPF